MRNLRHFFTLIGIFLLISCADSRKKKPYIDGLENDRYNLTLSQGFKTGNPVSITDQNGVKQNMYLIDIDGDGVADGIDLDGDGVIDIRILKGNENRVSPLSFISPVDIDNNGSADYYLFFNIVNNVFQITFLVANSSSARNLIFLLDSANKITGLDVNGDGISDDNRLNGKLVGTAGPSTTAFRVYGQAGSFTAAVANNGGISATSLQNPSAIAIDASGVYIADYANNRVLFYPGNSTTATRVYGQGGSFTANTANNGGVLATSLNGPWSIALDASGVYVSDTNNRRVLYFSGTSTTATRVYGQAGSFTSNTVNNGGLSATSLTNTGGVAVDATGVYIADTSNHRVLFFAGTSTTATRVYGQAGSFTTATLNNGGISASSLGAPNGVAVDATGVYISDTGNTRVLYYPGTSTTATRVYGQAGSFTSNAVNNGGLSASSLQGPYGGVAIEASGIYIPDRDNNRVLYFLGTSTTASRVYGQAGSFTTNTTNNGGISASSLAPAFGVAVYSNNVYIADYSNMRVLVY